MELVLGSEIKPVVSIESTLEKLDIRTGRVLEVELSEDAPKKSYKLLIDFGRFGTRRSVARLTTHTKEELLDALVFAVLNFEPKMVGSTKSEVLVLGSNPENKFNWFWFSYFQNKPETGFDVGVGRITESKKVSDLSTNSEAWQAPGYNRTLDFTFVDNLKPTTAGSFWWMGPKTIIYSLPNWLDKDVDLALPTNK